MPVGHGGARRGAGKKKGTKWPSTISKEQARERVRQRVNAALDPMLDSQIANATGIAHLMLRDPKTGKFERVTDEAGIDEALKSDGQAVWIYTKDPSVQAWTDLANRALDKPAEQKHEIDVNMPGVEAVLAILLQARKRVADARASG